MEERREKVRKWTDVPLHRVEPSSEDSNRTSGVGFLVDSRLSYLTMIPMTFILF
jgi:hypothetical protein